MTDLRLAVRAFRTHPAYASVAILTLAIGIGAATAVFSIVNAVVFRPLPYAQSDRLVWIMDSNPPRLPEFSVAPGRFLEWQRRTRAFESLAAYATDTASLTGAGDPVRLRGVRITASAFPLLGISPLAGRVFTPNEDRPGADGVVMLSEATWRSRFAGNPTLVGQTILLDDVRRVVLGIMPATFRFPLDDTADWRPMAFSADERTRYGQHYLHVFAGLKPGVTIQTAGADLARAAREIEALPDNKGWTTEVVPYLAFTIRDVKSRLLLLFGAVGAVLLLACTNVANLLLARGLSRQGELVVRTALGASRLRLARQVMVESALLGLVGSLSGLIVAVVLVRVVTTWSSVDLPRLETIRLDAPSLLFAVVLAALTPVLFGLLPALQMSRTQVRELLAHGGRTGSATLRARPRALLIVGEVALAMVLVASATLLLRSFVRLSTVEPGFDVAGRVVVPLSLPVTGYGADDRREQFWLALLDRLSHAPGTATAALSLYVPFFRAGPALFGVSGATPEDLGVWPDGVCGHPANAGNRHPRRPRLPRRRNPHARRASKLGTHGSGHFLRYARSGVGLLVVAIPALRDVVPRCHDRARRGAARAGGRGHARLLDPGSQGLARAAGYGDARPLTLGPPHQETRLKSSHRTVAATRTPTLNPRSIGAWV
jgi:putative ABC transport system permease protein